MAEKTYDLNNLIWAQGSDIFFFADFQRETVNELIKLIYKNKDKKNLTLNIKSYGGEGTELRAAIDVVRKYVHRVHIIGYSMSAGFYLWCAAKYRSMEPSAELLYHEMSWRSDWKTLTEHRTEVENRLKEQKMLDSLVVSTGGFTQEELDQIKESRQKDYIIYYDEAKERGLINYDASIDYDNIDIDDVSEKEVQHGQV